MPIGAAAATNSLKITERKKGSGAFKVKLISRLCPAAAECQFLL